MMGHLYHAAIELRAVRANKVRFCLRFDVSRKENIHRPVRKAKNHGRAIFSLNPTTGRMWWWSQHLGSNTLPQRNLISTHQRRRRYSILLQEPSRLKVQVCVGTLTAVVHVSHRHLPQDLGESSEMIGVRVGDHDCIEAIHTALPQIRKNRVRRGRVTRQRTRPGVNQQSSVFRRRHENSVALPHIKEQDIKCGRSRTGNSSHPHAGGSKNKRNNEASPPNARARPLGESKNAEHSGSEPPAAEIEDPDPEPSQPGSPLSGREEQTVDEHVRTTAKRSPRRRPESTDAHERKGR
jgi:hypothetical protein